MTPGDTRYIALTTYRRDGRPVTTPVWAAPLKGNLYVVTARSTGKVRLGEIASSSTTSRDHGSLSFTLVTHSTARRRTRWTEGPR